MASPTTPSSHALGTILSVWAHPDDETYLAGGVMAAARDRGQRVVCASATAGERGSPDPAAWPPRRLGRVRRWEAAAAMAVLGVHEHHIHGLPDGGLADYEDAGLSWARGLVAEVRPDTILTFGPDGMTYHPDHIAVHRWVTRAWDEAGRPGRLLYAAPTVERLARFGEVYEAWNMYMTDERPAGVATADLALHHQLAGPALDRKLTALRAMATQTAELISAVGPEWYGVWIAEECFVDAAAGAPGRRPRPSRPRLVARSAGRGALSDTAERRGLLRRSHGLVGDRLLRAGRGVGGDGVQAAEDLVGDERLGLPPAGGR